MGAIAGWGGGYCCLGCCSPEGLFPMVAIDLMQMHRRSAYNHSKHLLTATHFCVCVGGGGGATNNRLGFTLCLAMFLTTIVTNVWLAVVRSGSQWGRSGVAVGSQWGRSGSWGRCGSQWLSVDRVAHSGS